jgi:sugar/nucleoside kinase (ribokinase family)
MERLTLFKCYVHYSIDLKGDPMSFDLIVLGHLTHDIIVTPDGKIHEALGGVAAYTALVAAQLDATVGIIAKVGNDFKEEYIKKLEKSNINLLGLSRVKEKTTTFQNSYNESGERSQKLLNYISSINISDIPKPFLDAKCYHFGPVFHEVSYNIIKFINEKRILTSLDPQGYLRRIDFNHFIQPCNWKDANKVLPYINILKCDRSEAEKLTGTRDIHRASELLYAFGPKIVLITRGVQGSFLYYKEVLENIPIVQGKKVVDSTGAGDSYAAGFIVDYLATKNPKHSALFASCVASFVVEGIGTSNLPIKNKVTKRLERLLPKN